MENAELNDRRLEALLERTPDEPGVNNDLGYLYADQGKNLEKAESMIRKAVQDEPENPAYLDSLGWAYAQAGKIDLADPPLTKAADQEPKNSAIQDHLGDLRLKQNRRDEAIAAGWFGPVVTGREALVGANGEVVAWSGTAGRVRVGGEIWLAGAASAQSSGRTPVTRLTPPKVVRGSASPAAVC